MACSSMHDAHARTATLNVGCHLPPTSTTCRDNLRGFFEYCFPLLIKKIFGYDDREASWLFTVATVRGEAWWAAVATLMGAGQQRRVRAPTLTGLCASSTA